ncbi:phasin family protein [Yoonia sp.]|uniref:phasin family protein n=1 Tax=Yoonia sp. TaxID=2212373 RepID=UPI00391CAD63
MTKQDDTQTLAPDALEAFTAVAPLAPVSWMTAAWLGNVTAMSNTVAAFMAERLKEDLQTRQALLECKTLGEVRHVQATFVQNAIAQYQAETGRLIAMTGRLAADLHAKPKS